MWIIEYWKKESSKRNGSYPKYKDKYLVLQVCSVVLPLYFYSVRLSMTSDSRLTFPEISFILYSFEYLQDIINMVALITIWCALCDGTTSQVILLKYFVFISDKILYWWLSSGNWNSFSGRIGLGSSGSQWVTFTCDNNNNNIIIFPYRMVHRINILHKYQPLYWHDPPYLGYIEQ